MRPTDSHYVMHGPLIIVLTGGVASGKSTAAELFHKRGVPIVDTDDIARRIVEPGMPALDRIVGTFGKAFLSPDGNLDRRKMRAEIFSRHSARKQLEQILHPAIRQEALLEIGKLEAPYCILIVPLFVESDGFIDADRVLVVDVAEDLQLERLLGRDGLSHELAVSMIDAQASREQRLARANDVIDNRGDLESLDAQVDKLHALYLQLADQKQTGNPPRH